MEIDQRNFYEYLKNFSFEKYGDNYERNYGHYLSTNFPNCEKMWRSMIVPLTKRIEDYPQHGSQNIEFRDNVDSMLINLASIHYSLFVNLIFTFLHLEKRMDCSPENIFTHLGSVCDLTESFLEEWYLLLLFCRQNHSEVLENLSEDQFIVIARDWYKNKYSILYQNYFSKGKHFPIKIPSRDNIIDEYLSNYPGPRKEYRRVTQLIRDYRNAIVHDVRIGRIIIPGDKIVLPNASCIKKYRRWENILAVINQQNIIESEFTEVWELLETNISTLQKAINSLFEIVLNEFQSEFFSTERTKLRDMYHIELSSIEKMGTSSITSMLQTEIAVQQSQRIPPSGIFTTGSGTYKSGKTTTG